QAAGNLNRAAQNITNGGSIQSTSGNINLQNVEANNLLVNNQGGTLQALAGAINVNTLIPTGLQGSNNVAILGGQILAQSLNINAPGAEAIVDVEKILGTVNVTA